MKKVLLFVLTLAIVAGAAFSVFAAENTTAQPEDCTCAMVRWNQRDTLPAEKKTVFETAREQLKDASPDGYLRWDFFYNNADGKCQKCDILLAPNVQTKAPGTCMTYQMELPKKTAIVLALAYENGAWVKKTAEYIDSGIVVRETADGPVAVFVTFGDKDSETIPHSVDSPTARGYLELMRAEGCPCRIVLWGQRDTLAADKKAAFEAAKESLKEAVPEGYACRDFVYHDMSDPCEKCDIDLLMKGTAKTAEEGEDNAWLRKNGEKVCAAYEVELSLDGVSSVAVKQYVNNAWVERDAFVSGNTVSVWDLVDGPVAIFMK